jgi:hypothetical protein
MERKVGNFLLLREMRKRECSLFRVRLVYHCFSSNGNELAEHLWIFDSNYDLFVVAECREELGGFGILCYLCLF